MDENTKRIMDEIAKEENSSLSDMASVYRNMNYLAQRFGFSIAGIGEVDESCRRPIINRETRSHDAFEIYFPRFDDDARCALYCSIGFFLIVYSRQRFLGQVFSFKTISDYDDLRSFFNSKTEVIAIIKKGMAKILPKVGIDVNLYRAEIGSSRNAKNCTIKSFDVKELDEVDLMESSGGGNA